MVKSQNMDSLVRKSRRYLLSAGIFILLTAVAVGGYIWYALPNACEVSAVEEASSILVIQTKRYDEVYQSATAATPTSLVAPVSVMQQILMDTQEVAVPACLHTAKSELVNYMGTVIRAFMAYSARETNAAVRDLVRQSEAHFDRFNTELEAVSQCAPFCPSQTLRWWGD